MKRILAGLPLLVATSVFAQDPSPAEAAGNAAGAMFGLGCGCLIWLAILAVWIVLAIWVFKDAKKRGMENALLLCIVTLLTGPLGVLIYIMMRPKSGPPAAGV